MKDDAHDDKEIEQGKGNDLFGVDRSDVFDEGIEAISDIKEGEDIKGNKEIASVVEVSAF